MSSFAISRLLVSRLAGAIPTAAASRCLALLPTITSASAGEERGVISAEKRSAIHA